jgi:hypothetical protein
VLRRARPPVDLRLRRGCDSVAAANAAAYSQGGFAGANASATTTGYGPSVAAANAAAYTTPWGSGAQAAATAQTYGLPFGGVSYAAANAAAFSSPFGGGYAAANASAAVLPVLFPY